MARRRGWLKRRFQLKLKRDTVFSVAYILLFALAFLVSLSFTRQGLFLFKLNAVLIGAFGWAVFFLVLFLLLLGLMLTKFEVPWNQPAVLSGGVLLAICLMALTKSGWAGQAIFSQIADLITPFGAYGILSGGALVGFVVFFNTSFDQVVISVGSVLRSVGRFWRQLFAGRLRTFPSEVAGKPGVRPEPVVRESAKLASGKEAVELPPSAVNVPGAQGQVWHFPPLALLEESGGGKADRGDIKTNAATIERTLDSFGISANVAEVNPGPAVTQYAIEVALGTKLSKITTLANDLALALAAPGGQIRVEAPIPGRSLVGIELPNRSPEIVTLRQILASDLMKNSKGKLAVPLGLDVSGRPKIGDIARMPHVLIAGQTGSGKSVMLNSWIASFLFRTTPSELRMILVDPKRVELTQYNGVPHLLTPVIVEPEKVVSSLKWATEEMDRRYKTFAQVGARNLEMYNEMAGFQSLPYIVIIVDELADVILFAPAEVEDAICRIAQMSRATGIHLVISTQRPSVDVLTGLIKANIPCRISFAVSSLVDSRVIIDSPGAEKLLGRGDMLYIPPDQAKPTRIQGAYVSETEIKKLIDFLSRSGVRPVYTETVAEQPLSLGRRPSGGEGGERDELFQQAVRLVSETGHASASFLQRRMSVGYARAARLLDAMEQMGIIGPADGAKPRDVLIKDPSELLTDRPT